MERGVELGVVRALHQQRLGYAIELQGGAEIHVQLLGDQHLRRRVGQGWPGRQPPRQLPGPPAELAVLHQHRGQAHRQRFLGIDALPE